MTTIIIIAFIVCISLFSWKKPELQRKFMLNPSGSWRGKRIYQIITSGLIHKDGGHLFMNMYVLFMFGITVEDAFGKIYSHGSLTYALIFFSGIIVSSLIDVLLKHGDPDFKTLGASGGVATVLFASITLFPMDGIGLIFLPIMIPGFLFGILYLLYCVYKDFQNDDSVNHMAHFVGSLWGIVFMLLTWPDTLSHFSLQLHGL